MIGWGLGGVVLVLPSEQKYLSRDAALPPPRWDVTSNLKPMSSHNYHFFANLSAQQSKLHWREKTQKNSKKKKIEWRARRKYVLKRPLRIRWLLTPKLEGLSHLSTVVIISWRDLDVTRVTFIPSTVLLPRYGSIFSVVSPTRPSSLFFSHNCYRLGCWLIQPPPRPPGLAVVLYFLW